MNTVWLSDVTESQDSNQILVTSKETWNKGVAQNELIQ